MGVIALNLSKQCMRLDGMAGCALLVRLKIPMFIWQPADLQLTPSLDDPFPRVNLEAACLGKPVVAFKPSGGSAEFVGR